MQLGVVGGSSGDPLAVIGRGRILTGPVGLPGALGCFWEGLLDLFSEFPGDGEGLVTQVYAAVDTAS